MNMANKDSNSFQFCGQPCGRHGSYAFYKSIKYEKDNKLRRLSVGDFFFVKISQDSEIGIGEVQLLWEDKSADVPYMTSSVRLYVLPQDTPEGRRSFQGQVRNNTNIFCFYKLKLLERKNVYQYGHSIIFITELANCGTILWHIK